jgi:hypothetical protein
MKGGIETECLSRGSRRIVKLRPSLTRFAKRSFWKRQRRFAKIEPVDWEDWEEIEEPD